VLRKKTSVTFAITSKKTAFTKLVYPNPANKRMISSWSPRFSVILVENK